MSIGWSTDFIVVVGEANAALVLERVRKATAQWVLVEREGGRWRYVFSRQEVLNHPHIEALRASGRWTGATTLTEALDLHETQSSAQVPDSTGPVPLAGATLNGRLGPSAQRLVEVDTSTDRVRSVGGPDVVRVVRTRGMRPPAPAAALPAASEPPRIIASDDGLSHSVTGVGGAAMPESPGMQPETVRLPISAAQAAAEADEGTAPVRHPSIDADLPPRPGGLITLTVDLLHEAVAHTPGMVALGPQPADWSSLELNVTLVSAAIDFDNGGAAPLTVRRNANSVPARISGRVHNDVAEGSAIDVIAQFWSGTRFCGSAVRRFTALPTSPATPYRPTPPQPTQGAVQVDTTAEAPDLTVYITLFDSSSPGKMHWRLVTAPFDTLPAKLDGLIDLGGNPAAEAAKMFKEFAKLERGKHRARIEGFGERLWDRAPAEFRAAYWALHDHYQRPLTIQFVSDDPHLPWELMRPYRDGEMHPPLALRHAVARWIGRWHGYMRNRLPSGRLIAVAPQYRGALRLSKSEDAARRLETELGAERLQGTVDALRALLEDPPEQPVAVLHFSGHGVFDAEAAEGSLIKLEGGSIAVDEVARQAVKLGERHGTLVIFNACEVGATAQMLGTVGGWADAFLSRRFRAFIAPLWAIDEEDAAEVAQELVTRLVKERASVGSALRDLRAKHGDVSPTFFSYLLYGDVTAHLGA